MTSEGNLWHAFPFFLPPLTLPDKGGETFPHPSHHRTPRPGRRLYLPLPLLTKEGNQIRLILSTSHHLTLTPHDKSSRNKPQRNGGTGQAKKFKRSHDPEPGFWATRLVFGVGDGCASRKGRNPIPEG